MLQSWFWLILLGVMLVWLQLYPAMRPGPQAYVDFALAAGYDAGQHTALRQGPSRWVAQLQAYRSTLECNQHLAILTHDVVHACAHGMHQLLHSLQHLPILPIGQRPSQARSADTQGACG